MFQKLTKTVRKLLNTHANSSSSFINTFLIMQILYILHIIQSAKGLNYVEKGIGSLLSGPALSNLN